MSAAAELAEATAKLAAIIGHGAQGAALARALAREGVRGRAGLRRPAVLARLPRAAQSAVLFSPARRTPLAAAEAVAGEVVRRLVFRPGPGRPRRYEVIPVGSTRRRAPWVGDLDFLVVVRDPAALERALPTMALAPARAGDRLRVADTYAAGVRRRGVILEAAARPGHRPARYRADFFATTPAALPFALFHYTGSGPYTVRVRAHAKRRGWKLNQYGVFEAATGRRVPGSARIRSERDLAAFLGVTFRAPPGRVR